MQADLVLEEPRVLYLDPKAARRKLFHRQPGAGSLPPPGFKHRTLKPTPKGIYILPPTWPYPLRQVHFLIIPLPMSQEYLNSLPFIGLFKKKK
ncbi:rCG57216 [Rattus norvegicus]|uniref:RCG57216 n=1 Tax=Rattus norvegicus TaxID=10116 RepID=A6KPH1_RAT|nr:rCG57216 [Rattus norvegicus]